MNLRNLLGLQPKAETSRDLRADLDRIAAARSAAAVRAAALEAERGAVLLDADPEAAERHEAELRAVREEAERLAAMAAAMPPRIAAAEARELAAELDAEAAAAERIAAEAALLFADYERAAAEALRLVSKINAATVKVQDMNRRLKGHGRARVPLPLARAWPRAVVGYLAGASLPGPRGLCPDADAFAAEAARARLAPPDAAA